MSTERMPAYFISHGGGPWPWMDDMRREFAPLERSFTEMPGALPGKPRAVLMVSGHWETADFEVMTAPQPPMLYDYYNFPRHTYDVVYPSPGAPEIAERAAALIADTGLPVRTNSTRGYDHGTFVPMQVIYPQADVPVFQVSIRTSYDPAEHVALGRALAPLRQEGVLIVGSGLSYHNLRQFGAAARAPSAAFDSWLNQALALPAADRTNALLQWENAPHARTCHPEEDHLVPIFAALGAAENEVATRVYHQKDIFGGVTASSWRFG